MKRKASDKKLTSPPNSDKNGDKGGDKSSDRNAVTETAGTQNSSDSTVSEFPVVGIGASAGGLAAFEAFFSGMPADGEPGMAFVLVQHLAPDHKSVLSELVGRYTRMRVLEVEHGISVTPNCAYIIPPGYNMGLYDGTLQLFRFSEPRGRRLPIDFFFRTLAEDRQQNAIGIVLSGTGADGTQGVRAIKGHGGMIMSQTPTSAEYDGMPRSVIATGLVDYELPPNEMGEALIAYATHIQTVPPSERTVPTPKIQDSLKKVFAVVRSRCGHDFSHYKTNTIVRRIERRMAVTNFDTMDSYVKHLQDSSTEAELLFRDLLIGVTSFFRDPEAFAALENIAIPKLFADKSTSDTIRVWSPACATGEEAYSVAMLLHEHMDALKLSHTLQVFATDIDVQSITTARSGRYPASIAGDITPERLERFFTVESTDTEGVPLSYCVNKKLRDSLIFSEQDVISDPPFSKLDLITCRNLMIYLTGDAQKRIIPLFHYALNPGGMLFLGTSESVGEHADLFDALNQKAKLYQRKEAIVPGARMNAARFLPSRESRSQAAADRPAETTKAPLREVAEQTMLRHLAPAGALVDSKGDILYLHGRTGRYLEPVVGKVETYNIVKMAREGLQPDLATVLRDVVQTGETVRRRGLRVKTNGDYATVNLSICPAEGAFAGEESAPPLYLVVLEELQDADLETHHARADASSPNGDDPSLAEADPEAVIASLRKELQIKEEYLRTVNEELEASNSDLETFVEEMQSMNEEMQSTNEELETSKEELQSTNEELATVNAELQAKVSDLSRANDDMNNLLAGTGIATVFLDNQLRILRFTPAAAKLINLIEGDIGRPVAHILTNLVDYEDMMSDIQQVVNTLVTKNLEVQDATGTWFSLRILPYRTVDNVIEGVVMNFVDISDRKYAEDEIKRQLSEKEMLLKEVHHRIRNSFASIASLLSTQADEKGSPEAREALNEAGSRINCLSVLYDKLLISDQYVASSVKSYIESLLDSILALFPNGDSVTVRTQIADFALAPARLFPLGLIINELVTNIMKYAFVGGNANSGVITVTLNRVGNHAVLTIEDNGIGLPEGFDLTASQGFGFTLVRMLSEQLGGSYTVESEEGTRSVLEFNV